MKKSNLHGVYLTDVLTEMCTRVGVKYSEVNFLEDEWYLKHAWSKKDRNKFIEWFAKYLRNMGPRRELCQHPSLVRTKDERNEFAEMLVDQFGWKTI